MIGFSTILSLFITSSILVWCYIKWTFTYFERNKVPFIPPTPIIGNISKFVFGLQSPAATFRDLYNHKYAKNEPFVGIYLFNKPAILVRDPELIKRVMIKDFNYFLNRTALLHHHQDRLGAYSMFFLKNPEWRELRLSMSKIFTTMKIKKFMEINQEIGCDLDDHLSNTLKNKPFNWNGLDVNDLCARYIANSMALIAFGIKSNSFANEKEEFWLNGENLVPSTTIHSTIIHMIRLFPEISSLLRLKFYDESSKRFLQSCFNEVMAERVKSDTNFNDVMEYLLKLRNSGSVLRGNEQYKDDILFSQSIEFLVAGSETSSSMSFALYHLALDQEIQKRVRDEIKQLIENNDGKITYEAISGMEYLTAVLYESLRLYPVSAFLDRECTPPAGEKGYSLQPYSDYEIPKGMTVYVPLYGLHMDDKYFPNPEEFNPERFLPENKANLTTGTYLGFGIGPRSCIAQRFGIMQAKYGLVNVLKNYRLIPNERTTKKFEFCKKALSVQSEGSLFVDYIKDPLI